MTERQIAYAVALAVVAPLLAVYLCSAPHTLPEADAGEFAAVAVHGGIPHPPGYPLHVFALQLFARLPFGLIRSLVISSLVYACGAALLLACTLRERGVRPFDAWVATLAVFISTNVWRAATSFEPFALNLLLASALIYTCARLASAQAQPLPWLLTIGLLFGLGVCAHHSLVCLAPLPAAVLLRLPQLRTRRALWLVAGFAVGLTPLCLFVVMRHQNGWIWGDWQDFWPRLLTHVLRREYGTFTLARSSRGDVSYGPLRMLGTLPRVLSYGFFVLLLLGGASAGRRMSARRGDGFAIGSTLSFLSAGLLFPALFRFTGTPMDNLIVDRFLALPMLLLALPIAAGLCALRSVAGRSDVLLALTLLAAHVTLVWPQAERASHHFYEDHLRNIFAIAEPGSTLMVVADGGFSGGLYGQYVWNRRDIQLVISGLGQPWYVARLARWLPLAARRHAPLYLLDLPTVQRAQQPPTYPLGPLLRVVDANTAMPSASDLFEQNRALFATLRLPTASEVSRMDAWEAEDLTNYARAWQMIATRLQAEGQLELAARADSYRAAFSPP